MSGSRRNTKRTFTPQDRRSFYLVGSDLFLGLVFASTQDYTYKINRTLVSTPTFLFYNSQTKVIIDYSNSKNTDDLSFVSAFFNSLSAGVTFTFQNASYVEDGVQVKADLSGTYSFDKFEQSKIVKANVVSTTNLSSKKDSYLPKFFTNTPQIAKASGSVSSTQQRKNIIKNTLSSGLYSFKRLGLRVGDFIDFSGTDSNQWNKMKVVDLFTDTDGFEVIQVDRDIADENLIGSPVLINVYFEGEPVTEGTPQNKTYGTCVIRFAAGNSVCFPCQNEFQCNERTKQLGGISSIYTENTTCDEDQIQTITATITPTITAITGATQFTVIDATPQLVVNGLTTVSKKMNLQIIELSYENGSLTDNGTSLKEYTLGLSSNLKIILTNSNLLGYQFVFSSTEPNSKITEITDNIIKSGTPGKANSYIAIQSGTTPQTIYVTSTDRKLYFQVTVK